jgi:acyl carrier protein phosphodiesterase
MVGNFLADAISNKDIPDFPKGVQAGILLHRKIDSYTDAHPKVREGTKLLHAKHRKYAPVLIDVFFDYFLAKHWDKFSTVSLEKFRKNAYEVLAANRNLMPAGLQKNLPYMIADDWLMNYGSREGLEFTFSKMAKRVRLPKLVENATSSLFENEAALEKVFLDFFPDVVQYVSEECPEWTKAD